MNNFRILKTINVSLYIVCFWLTYKLLFGQLDWALMSGALAVGGCWLGLTVFWLRSLFTTYFDRMSRLRVLVPTTLGLLLAAIALFCNGHWSMHVIAGVEVVAWLAIYIAYRRNRANFEKMGRGLLPKGAWISPTPLALRPGDMILTSGNMANTLRDSVGHGEVVFLGSDGKLYTFTSYMKKGALTHRVETVTSKRTWKGDYIVMRLRTPLSVQQIALGQEIAEQMVAENVEWIEKVNTARPAFINKLWLPRSIKNWLIKKTKADGYDWVGLFVGVYGPGRWTCVAGCIEWYRRNGVKLRKYGTGLLGLGTGFFNPIMPIRFVSDPKLELLSEAHREEFERTHTGVQSSYESPV
ncbi:MAG: hypothetical protein K2W95_32140 [Candidatus Obscuribacterales bacterium]|nr:hypothetical protein [Candidatus Obscuribacterales bacterium]